MSKPKRMWLVRAVYPSVTVFVGGPFGDREQTMPFAQMADGCMGVCYVFKTKRQAKKFDGNAEISEIIPRRAAQLGEA